MHCTCCLAGGVAVHSRHCSRVQTSGKLISSRKPGTQYRCRFTFHQADPPSAAFTHRSQALCNAPLMDGLIRFFGAYHAADRGQIAVVLEYMDGGSLADVVQKVGRTMGGC